MTNKKNNKKTSSFNDTCYNFKGGKNYKHNLYLYKTEKDVNNMTESYIKFELIDKNTKTSIYSVKNKKSDDLLGFIKWYDVWKQYCFFPMNFTIFCRYDMKDINDFISKITEEKS